MGVFGGSFRADLQDSENCVLAFHTLRVSCCICAISTLMAASATGADLPNPPQTHRVQRVPDTWEVIATGESIYFGQGPSSFIGDRLSPDRGIAQEPS